MAFDIDRAWRDPVHREFVAGLDATQSGALLRLLLVATFADMQVSPAERATLARALGAMPAFEGHGWGDFDTVEADAVIDGLYERWIREPNDVLAEIAEGLGDETARRHGFRMVVQFLQADGFVEAEALFVRGLGERLGVEEEIVQFAVTDAGEGEG